MSFRILLVLLCLVAERCIAFVAGPIRQGSAATNVPSLSSSSASCGHHSRTKSVLFASVSRQGITEARRQTLLSRKGPFFRLDRFSGAIEFGATVDLVTQLETEPSSDAITEWLRDGRSLALSIWAPKLTQEMPDSVYRLQIMTLQFVTLQLAPWVECQMKTYIAQSKSDPTRTMPIFCLQSVNFDPNVQLFPGMRITAESLGIVIHVVGELRPTRDGKGVSGSITFSTRGELPPPLRILPESSLQAASDSINDTVVKFATQSFQTGAKANYDLFRQRYNEQKKKEKSTLQQ